MRRKKLSIDGTNKKPNETWEDCEKELDTLLKESLDIEEEVVIEKSHKKKTDKSKKGNTLRRGGGAFEYLPTKKVALNDMQIYP